MKRLILGASALTLMLACSGDGSRDSAAPTSPVTSAGRATPSTEAIAAHAASGPSTGVSGPQRDCPPTAFVNNTNLAVNPSFELGGPPVSWPPGPAPVQSAATGWFMHTDNLGSPITSARVTTNVPGPGGTKMLHYTSGGIEGGVYQTIVNPPAKMMFSAWVRVIKGQVLLSANNGTTGPYAWTEKKATKALPNGEWEQIRVCTDGTVPTGFLVLWNEAAGGGDFYVDRVEARELP
jgi:hypothetical protein